MKVFCLRSGRLGVVVALSLLGSALAAEQFPFDQELMLDAAPMRPGKHMPMLIVAPNGDAKIELWCKTVPARVDVSESAVKIEAAPLPDALPDMMGRDQCTPARIAADADLLADIVQSTEWKAQGSGLVLAGPKTLKFRLSDH